MWIDEAALACTSDSEPKRGCPRLYGDALIQALRGLKTVFRLPLRARQGFAQSLRDLAFAALPVPNYTILCHRAQTLEVQLPIIRDGEPIHLAVDSTGVKVYGEGLADVRVSRADTPATAADRRSAKATANARRSSSERGGTHHSPSQGNVRCVG